MGLRIGRRGRRSDDLYVSPPSSALILSLFGRGDCYNGSGLPQACDGEIIANAD